MINKIFSKIYGILPVFIQNLFISLYGIGWYRRRFRGEFNTSYELFKNRERYNNNQWLKYVNSELKKVLIHSYKNVQYYRDLFMKNGISLSDLEDFTVDDLHKIPLLEKNILRELGSNLLLSSVKEPGGKFFSSSGSTGTPTKILYSLKMHQVLSAAFESRIRNWAGLTYRNSRGMIGGRRIVTKWNSNGPFYRYNFIENQIYFSAYHINAKNTPNYVKAINKHKPDYMTGYAQSNYFLARFIEEGTLSVKPLKAVITSSEKLTKEMRDTFKRVYGCRTYDSYSGVEACSLISECEYGKLHISQDVGFIEFIKSNGNYAKPGEIGEMICTGFLNYNQPLIRYRIGDLAILSLDQKCECKRNMPIVDEIIGRIEDTVIGKDGRQMVRFHGVFVDIDEIIEGQIIQYTVDNFEVRLILSAPLKKNDEELIFSRMKSQLGDVSIVIKVVDNIPRNNNGKFKSVVSHLNNA